MTEKELKKLSRTDLLEMLLALSKENEILSDKVTRLQAALDDRIVRIENSGSLAEAILMVNGMFEATQAACDQYTHNIRQRHQEQELICQRMEEEAREHCRILIEEAQMKADEYRKHAEEEIRALYDIFLQETKRTYDVSGREKK